MKRRNTNPNLGALALAFTLAAATLALLIAKLPAQAAVRNLNPRVLLINSMPCGD